MLKRFTLLIAIILPTFYSFSLAGDKAGSINLGRNIAIRTGSEYWNGGFSLGGNVFWYKNPHIFYGIRIAYSTRSSNQYSRNISIFEAVPSIRIASMSKDPLNIFGQFGLGYYRSQFNGQQFLGTEYWNFYETRNSLGFSFGGGLLMGLSKKIGLEIFPLFSFLAHSNPFFNNYFTINIGFFSRGK